MRLTQYLTEAIFKELNNILLYRGAKTTAGLIGAWWTPSKKYAEHYTHGVGKITSFTFNTLKLINFDSKAGFEEFKRIKGDIKTNKELAQQVIKSGYDGTIHFKGQEIHIYNLKKLPKT